MASMGLFLLFCFLCSLKGGSAVVVRSPVGLPSSFNTSEDQLCADLNIVRRRTFEVCEEILPSFKSLVKENSLDGKFYFATLATDPSVPGVPTRLLYQMSRLRYTYARYLPTARHLYFFTLDMVKDAILKQGFPVASVETDICRMSIMPEEWVKLLESPGNIKIVGAMLKFLVARYVVELGVHAVILDADVWLTPPNELLRTGFMYNDHVTKWQDNPEYFNGHEVVTLSVVMHEHFSTGGLIQRVDGLLTNAPVAGCQHRPRGQLCPRMLNSSSDEVFACACIALLSLKATTPVKQLLDDMVTFLIMHPVWDQDLFSKLLPLYVERGLDALILNPLSFSNIYPGGTRTYMFPFPGVVLAHSGNKRVRVLGHCEDDPQICSKLHGVKLPPIWLPPSVGVGVGGES